MKNWEMVAEAVVFGSAGIAAEKSLTIPISSGNALVDGIGDILLGVAAMYVGVKYVKHEAAGIAVTAGGAGWALSGIASMLGLVL